MTATWLESSSLEQQRGMANETDRDRHRLDEVDEENEMQRIEENEMETNRGSKQDYSTKAGKIINKEGNKEELTSLAWRFWKETPASSRCNKEEVQEHINARDKKTIQVECEVADISSKES